MLPGLRDGNRVTVGLPCWWFRWKGCGVVCGAELRLHAPEPRSQHAEHDSEHHVV